MSDDFTTLAYSAVISVALGVFLRQRGWGIAIPLLIAGAIVGRIPIGPDAPPEPEVILVAILAPLVFGEALGSSYIDLRKVSRPVLLLAIGLVIATTLVIGVAASLAVAMPLAMAFALGGVLAPTDAVAVSAVAKRAGLPRRLVSILEGESLVNDGTGLTALRIALVAAAAGAVTMAEVGATFALAVLVGVGVGFAGGLVLSWVLTSSADAVAANSLILVAPFGLYLFAEHLEGSGILAVVVAALIIAHRQQSDPTHTGRLQTATLWKHITFSLQCLAFFLIGIELPAVLMRIQSTDMSGLLVLVPLVLVLLIVVRAIFVLGMVGLSRATREAGVWRGAVIMAWAGARGPVSGLGAFSIPVAFVATGEIVPFRDLIIATTLVVIVLTLLLSLTLAPLARALGVKPDDDSETLAAVESRLARAALERLVDIAAEDDFHGQPLCPDVAARLRAETERRLEAVAPSATAPMTTDLASLQYREASRAIVRAEQEELILMRDNEGLPSSIIRPLLRRLDERDHALRHS